MVQKNEDGIKITRNGTVEIRDNKITVKNPSGKGKPARIQPCKGVKLFINDILINEAVEITEDSSIRVEIEDTFPIRNIDVIFSEGNLKALIKVHYEDGIKYGLKNKMASNNIMIEVVPTGKIECSPFELDDVKKVLKEKGVVYGIMEDRILEAISSKRESFVEVAEGIRAVDGRDDIIVPKYENNKENRFDEINGKVDFYSGGKVPSVEKGDFIAEKLPGDDGTPGIDVFGKIIKQRMGKRLKLSAGSNVRVSEDGTRAYALISGRPEIKGEMVSVNEIYEVPKNVDISTGHIKFVGDVIIRGDVTEGMKVTAGNSIIIYGSVISSEITAGGDIEVHKNIIGSTLRAGAKDVFIYELIEVFTNIKECIANIFYSVKALKETGKVPKIYDDGKIIKLVIDTKFNRLNDIISEIQTLLYKNKNSIDMGILQLGAKLIKYFKGNSSLNIKNYEDLLSYCHEIEEEIVSLKNKLKEPRYIHVNYIQNSTLSTSGDIKVSGKGCYNSELYCKGSIVFERIGSVLRGGTIRAGKDIKIYELGSQGGAVTTAIGSSDSVIECEIAHTNSVIQLDSMSQKLESSVKKLKAYILKGELMIEKSKL